MLPPSPEIACSPGHPRCSSHRPPHPRQGPARPRRGRDVCALPHDQTHAWAPGGAAQDQAHGGAPSSATGCARRGTESGSACGSAACRGLLGGARLATVHAVGAKAALRRLKRFGAHRSSPRALAGEAVRPEELRDGADSEVRETDQQMTDMWTLLKSSSGRWGLQVEGCGHAWHGRAMAAHCLYAGRGTERPAWPC